MGDVSGHNQLHSNAESALDSVGILEGTDKSSLGWDYLRHFEREFAPFRDRQITVIEIGVAGGPSLRVWKQFFSRAKIVGVDINPKCVSQAGGRAVVEIGSQADGEFLTGICQRHGTPTIVIDDGSHHADHIQFTFEHLFPLVAPGGCYVIEDIHFHFNPPTAKAWRGAAAIPPQDYVTALANRLLAAEFATNQSAMVPAPVRESIDRLSFLPGAVIIWKRDDADLSVRLSRWERLAEQSGNSWCFESLARQILSRGGSLVQAERAARRAVKLNPRDPSVHHTLSRVLEQVGDFAGAVQAIQAAIALLPSEDERGAGFTRRLETLRQRLSTDAA
jgi:hypothetical protein